MCKKFNGSAARDAKFAREALNTHVDPVTFYIDRKRPQDYVDITAIGSSGVSTGNISMFLDTWAPGSNIADGGGTTLYRQVDQV